MQYLVAAGNCTFMVEADCAASAIENLKERILARKHRYDPNIGMSLVEALEQNRLNFLVFNAERTELLLGELHGVRQQPVRHSLAEKMARFIPRALMHQVLKDTW